MDVRTATPLLGGLSPRQFMRAHWQKSPCLIRQAWPGVRPPLTRAELFALAAQDDVESRLVQRTGPGVADWSLRRGPLQRRQLPPVRRPGWTLLVQGLDLHVPVARAMLEAFRFVPDARLDDLMLSWASDGGGVGPHVDSYDVFLLQVSGTRRWRVAPPSDERFVPGLPLRILERFEPQSDWVLEPGDMLYLPPRWSHDGVAVGEDCMTCSIGFRVPARDALAADLLQRLWDGDEPGPLYRDPQQAATVTPARVPAALQAFAGRAVARLLAEPGRLEQALGEALSEPKPQVWFAPGGDWSPADGLRLDARTRMLYDEQCVYINGESLRARGADALLVRALADQRWLAPAACRRLSAAARAEVAQWVADGWAHPADGGRPGDAPA